MVSAGLRQSPWLTGWFGDIDARAGRYVPGNSSQLCPLYPAYSSRGYFVRLVRTKCVAPGTSVMARRSWHDGHGTTVMARRSWYDGRGTTYVTCSRAHFFGGYSYGFLT